MLPHLPLHVADDDPGALGDEQLGGGGADARRPARDHRDLPVQSTSHPGKVTAMTGVVRS